MNATPFPILPGPDGSWTPCPELMTWDEAIRYLRLDTTTSGSPRDSLRRYINQRKLKSTRVGRWTFFRRVELDRFLEEQTN